MLWLKNTHLLLHSMLPDGPGRWNLILSLIALSISLSLVGCFERQGKYKTPWSEGVTCSWDFFFGGLLEFFAINWLHLTFDSGGLHGFLLLKKCFHNDSAMRGEMRKRNCYVMKHEETHMKYAKLDWASQPVSAVMLRTSIIAEAVPSPWYPTAS